jgi:hypothetical protein
VRCGTWPTRRASGSSSTSGPGCRPRTTPTRWPSGPPPRPAWCTWTPTRSVLAHARALLTSSPQGATHYVDADLRDTAKICEQAAEILDFGAPLAILLIEVLHCIPDADDPAAIVATLVDAMPPGSYLVIAHPASDIHSSQISTATDRINPLMAEPVTMRTHDQVGRFFAGLGLVEPGPVQLHRWRPGPEGPVPDHDIANYGGIGRKP